MELESATGANPAGEIYAKVIGAAAECEAQTRVRFTSISPDLKVWLQETIAQLKS